MNTYQMRPRNVLDKGPWRDTEPEHWLAIRLDYERFVAFWDVAWRVKPTAVEES